MLKRAGRVRGLVLQIEVDAPRLGQRYDEQVRIGGPIGVGLDLCDRVVHPAAISVAGGVGAIVWIEDRWIGRG